MGVVYFIYMTMRVVIPLFFLFFSLFFWGVAFAQDVALDSFEAECSLLQEASPEKMECYRDIVGREYMRQGEYALATALSRCDSLDSSYQSYCWEGVFEENVSYVVEVGANFETGGFDEEDILAPCNRVDERYRSACYGAHGLYILRFFDVSRFPDPIEVCFTIEEIYLDVCDRSIRDAIPLAGYQPPTFDEEVRAVSEVEVDERIQRVERRSWLQRVLDFILGLLF